MIVSLIVAAAMDNAIGKDNQLLWHLPNDLRFFKNTTWAMPVVMGRKTYESMAGDPLPGRFNIIITSQSSYDPGNPDVWVVHNLEEAVKRAEETDCKEVFIAGGGEIYKQSMSIADRIYLTRVEGRFPEATVFFPEIDPGKWKEVSREDFPKDEKHAYPYSFQVWERKKYRKFDGPVVIE